MDEFIGFYDFWKGRGWVHQIIASFFWRHAWRLKCFHAPQSVPIFCFLKFFDPSFLRDYSMMCTCYTYCISVEHCIWLVFQYTGTGSRIDRSYKFMQARVPHRSFVYRDIKFFTEADSPLFRKRCFTVKLLPVATLNLELLSCGKQILSLNRPCRAGIRILT